MQEIRNDDEKPSELDAVIELFNDYLEFRIRDGMDLLDSAYRFKYSGSDSDKVHELVVTTTREILKLGQESGERYDKLNLITPQEFALFQGEHGEAGAPVKEFPYKPMVYHSKFTNIDVRNLSEQRKKLGFHRAFMSYYGLGDERIRISLEPLDNEGNTLRDPIPLDNNLKPINTFTKSDNFPFRRN